MASQMTPWQGTLWLNGFTSDGDLRLKFLRNMVKFEAQRYLDSNPWLYETGDSSTINNIARACLNYDFEHETLSRVLPKLLYRNRCNTLALSTLNDMDVAPVVAFDEFTPGVYRIYAGNAPGHDLLVILSETNIIPEPKEGEGYPSAKPYHFVVSSVLAAGLGREAFVTKLALLKKRKTNPVEKKIEAEVENDVEGNNKKEARKKSEENVEKEVEKLCAVLQTSAPEFKPAA